MVKYNSWELNRMKKTLLAVCILFLFVPAAAGAQTITVQAEYYTAKHDIDYIPISAAGYYLQGLDYTDEWTEYAVGVSNYGQYSVQMYCRGDTGVNYLIRLILTPMGTGDPVSVDIPFRGTGWG